MIGVIAIYRQIQLFAADIDADTCLAVNHACPSTKNPPGHAPLKVDVVILPYIIEPQPQKAAVIRADIHADAGLPAVFLAAVHCLEAPLCLDRGNLAHHLVGTLADTPDTMQGCLQVFCHLRVGHYPLQGGCHVVDALAGSGQVGDGFLQISPGLPVAVEGRDQHFQAVCRPHQAARHAVQVLCHLAHISLIAGCHLRQGACQPVNVGGDVPHVHGNLFQCRLSFLVSQHIVHGIQQCLHLQHRCIQVCHHVIHGGFLQAVEKIPRCVAVLHVSILGRGYVDELAPHDTVGGDNHAGLLRNFYAVLYDYISHHPKAGWLHTTYLANPHSCIAHIVAGGQADSLGKTDAQIVALVTAGPYAAQKSHNAHQQHHPQQGKGTYLHFCLHLRASLPTCIRCKKLCTRGSSSF